jgi:protein phosphatase 2C-like protein
MAALPVQQSCWDLTKASVRGKSHVDGNIPNQDYVEVLTSEDHGVVAAILCDGAGTALWSQVGARTTCQVTAVRLFEIGIRLRAGDLLESNVRQAVLRGLESARTQLAASGIPLSRFHCTVALCVIAGKRAFVGQIGDSGILRTRFAGVNSTSGKLDFFPAGNTLCFELDRGEYANETHFVTEEDWQAHLQFAAFDVSDLDALILMTDGAMDVATIRGVVFRGFLSNVVGKLLTLHVSAARDRLLAEWLSHPETHYATSDDKTMFVAIRAEHKALAQRPFVVDDESEQPELPKLPGPRVAATGATGERKEGAGAWQMGEAARVTASNGMDSYTPPYHLNARWLTVIVIGLLVLVAAALVGWGDGDDPFELRTRGELVPATGDGVEVDIPFGERAAVRLKMKATERMQIQSIDSVPRDALSITSDPGCMRVLTRKTPLCELRVSIQNNMPWAEYELLVRYRDLTSGFEDQLSVPVRALPAGGP